MNYEVVFSVQQGDDFIDIHVAWIHAETLSECKDIAEEIASKIEAPAGEIVLHIGELEN